MRLIEKVVGKDLRDRDLLVISSKYMAISEGRTVSLKDVRPTARAKELAQSYRMKEKLCELVLRESDTLLVGYPVFFLR